MTDAPDDLTFADMIREVFTGMPPDELAFHEPFARILAFYVRDELLTAAADSDADPTQP